MSESEEPIPAEEFKKIAEVLKERYKCIFDLEEECPVRRFLAEKKAEAEELLKAMVTMRPIKQSPDKEFSNMMDTTMTKYIARLATVFGESTLGEFCIACMLKRLVKMNQPSSYGNVRRGD